MNKDFWKRVDQLEELAGKATQKAWDTAGHEFEIKGAVWRPIYDVPYLDAASPAFIMELIAELRMLENEADWLATFCIDACDYRHGDCEGCAFSEQGICPTEKDTPANKPEAWRELARKYISGDI